MDKTDICSMFEKWAIVEALKGKKIPENFKFNTDFLTKQKLCNDQMILIFTVLNDSLDLATDKDKSNFYNLLCKLERAVKKVDVSTFSDSSRDAWKSCCVSCGRIKAHDARLVTLQVCEKSNPNFKLELIMHNTWANQLKAYITLLNWKSDLIEKVKDIEFPILNFQKYFRQVFKEKIYFQTYKDSVNILIPIESRSDSN